MTLDSKISKALNVENIVVVSLYNFISIYSSLVVCLLIILFFDKTPRKQYIISLVLLIIIVFIFKSFTKRKRPYKHLSYIYNRDLIDNNCNSSFPSMHTMCATITSYMLFREYHIPYIFPIWPILTIISRVGLGTHYISDCVLTFVFSLGINFIFYL